MITLQQVVDLVRAWWRALLWFVVFCALSALTGFTAVGGDWVFAAMFAVLWFLSIREFQEAIRKVNEKDFQ